MDNKKLTRLMIQEALLLYLLEDDLPEQPKQSNSDTASEKPKEPKMPEKPESPKEFSADPADQAHALGLTYDGWGYYSDAQGNRVAQTIGDKLVRIDPNDPTHQTRRPQPSQEDPYGLGPQEPSEPKKIKIQPYSADADPYDPKNTPPLRGPSANKYSIKKILSPEKQNVLKKGIMSGKIKGQPGMIEPPTTETGDPWEVIGPNGKSGIIDFMDHDSDSAHVTFDDGTYGMFRTNDIKPKNPKTEFPAK